MSHHKDKLHTAPSAQAVAVKTENLQEQALAIQAQATAMSAQMAETGIEAGDLEIPKIMLMQNTSELVGDEKAKLGDMINTMSEEVIGGFSTPVEIVPLKLYKTLRIYDTSGAQPKFIRAEPLTGENSKLPWEGEENGVPVKRITNMNYFVLLKSEIDAGTAFPFVVSFKSTGMKAGKQLATHLFKLVALNRLPYSQSIVLSASKEKKDTNTYAVFGIGKASPLSPEGILEAKSWLVRLASMNVRVDERFDETAASHESGPTVAPHVVQDANGADVQGPY